MKTFEDRVMEEAEREVEAERFRAAVELAKVKVRKRRPFWDKVFPFRIIIVPKEKLR